MRSIEGKVAETPAASRRAQWPEVLENASASAGPIKHRQFGGCSKLGLMVCGFEIRAPFPTSQVWVLF